MKKRKINNDTNERIKLSIIIVIITVFIVIASIAYRNSTYTQSWLVCETDVEAHYHEVLKFRYDINDKLYGYYREEKIHDISGEPFELYYQGFQKQLNDVKDSMDDNFKYEVIKTDNEILAKTYIGVSIYGSFFNKYINNSEITSQSTINDIKTLLESKNYKCDITRK